MCQRDLDFRQSLKIVEVRAEARFLPPYSPDLNPIEQVFSKITTCLRRAAVRAERRLYNAIVDEIKIITPTDCLNCFRNSGYTSPKTSDLFARNRASVEFGLGRGP